MSPGPSFPKLLPVPPSPIKPLREILRQGRQQVGKAGEDIRSIAADMRGATTIAPQVADKAPPEQKMTPTTTQEPETVSQQEDIATACVGCAIGHYAGAAKLLNEAIRFRDDGIESNQVIDDIAGAIGELNAMERVDLTPERLQKTPDWERAIADEALRESRKLRHRLEGIGSMKEIEKAAADTESYYKRLNRQWYKGRFSHLGKEKVEAIEKRISPEEECETCAEARESIKQFIEKRKRQGT